MPKKRNILEVDAVSSPKLTLRNGKIRKLAPIFSADSPPILTQTTPLLPITDCPILTVASPLLADSTTDPEFNRPPVINTTFTVAINDETIEQSTTERKPLVITKTQRGNSKLCYKGFFYVQDYKKKEILIMIITNYSLYFKLI